MYKDLDISIKAIKGVGPKKEEKLNSLNIYKLRDLIEYYPYTYEDRTKIFSSSQCENGEKCLLKVTICNKPTIKKIRKNLTIIKVKIKDIDGDFFAVWYNTPYIANQIKIGDIYYLYGKASTKYGVLQIESPEINLITKNRDFLGLIPKYPLINGMTQADFRKSIRYIFKEVNTIKDYLPDNILKKYNLLDLDNAYRNIHFPLSNELLHKAKERLIINEFIELQIGLKYFKKMYIKDKGIVFKIPNEIDKFIKSLPYKLTGAQEKVLLEIYNDLDKEKRINRLIQGDVGSGKTIIAIILMYLSILNGYQSIMMVPTQILAQQHYDTIKSLLGEKAKILLFKSHKNKSERQKYVKEIAKGKYDIIIGTHSLIQDDIEFNNPGLIITDEQHRFGVKQRKMLSIKGIKPHVLVMSATPIPRTLSLILYGDLDISIIDEMPKGRKTIKTFSVDENYRERIYTFIKKEIQNGRQAYIVCPTINESEILDLQSVVDLYEKVNKTVFNNIPIAILHGEMKEKEKENIMLNFKNNKIKILISTTVIEVGIDVPNASVMVIENSERFGLAQLHQLRGRVGRGSAESYCILISQSKSEKSKNRLNIMTNTLDGFEIAKKDLEIRGPGDYFGLNQHGLQKFKLANLSQHEKLLAIANDITNELIENNKSEKVVESIFNNFKNKIHYISMN